VPRSDHFSCFAARGTDRPKKCITQNAHRNRKARLIRTRSLWLSRRDRLLHGLVPEATLRGISVLCAIAKTSCRPTRVLVPACWFSWVSGRLRHVPLPLNRSHLLLKDTTDSVPQKIRYASIVSNGQHACSKTSDAVSRMWGTSSESIEVNGAFSRIFC